MDEAEFAERMALIRARFAARLTTRVEETAAALPIAGGHGSDAAAAVATAYRRFHDMCGIGPTIGFNNIGQAARSLVDGVLVAPFRAERGLTTDEMTKLKEGLDAFRIAAQVDMHSMNNDRSI